MGIFAIGCTPKLSQTAVSDSEVPTRYALFEAQNFEWISKFVEGKAIAVLDGESIVIDQHGRKLMDYPYEDNYLHFYDGNLIVRKGTTSSVIDMEGNDIIPPDYTNMGKCICSDCGYFIATKDGQKGVISIEEKIFHPIENLMFAPLMTTDGLLLMMNKETNTTDLVSVDDTVVKNLPFRRITLLENDNFAVSPEGSSFIIDSRGDSILSLTYDSFSTVKENIITIKNNKSGIINKEGVELLAPKYDHIKETSGYYIFKDENKTGLLGPDMQIQYEYEETCEKNHFYSPYFICTKDSSPLVYNIETKALKEYPYKIGYMPRPFKHLFYQTANEKGLLNEDLSIKSTSGINAPVLGLEVIDVDKNKAILLPDGRKMNGKNYSSVKQLLYNNRLILGDSETKKVGLFSRSGETILPMAYKNIKHLHREYLTVNEDRKVGVVNQDGEVILEPKYSKIEYYNGVYIVKEGYTKSNILDENFLPIGLDGNDYVHKITGHRHLLILGNANSHALYDINKQSVIEQAEWMQLLINLNHIQVKNNELFKVMDLRNLSTTIQYQPNKFYTLGDGKKASKEYFEIAPESEFLRGIININGEELIPVGYGVIEWFNSERQQICLEKDGHSGVIDFNKEVVIPFIYDEIKQFSDGQSVVRIDQKFGIINEKGELITPIEYETIKSLGDGKRRMEKEGLWGFLNEKGQVIIAAKYEEVKLINNGLVIIKNDGLYGVINEEEEAIFPTIYDAFSYRYKNNGLGYYLVTLEGQKFKLNLDGECIEDCPEDSLLKKYGILKKE